ncbi:hypothetical protein CTAYLR_000794 [Chrysophaeum taylorii]|uniref:EF-hand domain-containing protein n=1 Tax=Chrysophaeum taylorii TaxID=2483200 RepID=A0AAD7XQS7_9STRA|nr:hypothetical protein CTAYLR_000794 [Chrysophaeum taylorii]
MPFVLVGIAVIFPIMARLGGYLLKAAENSFLNHIQGSQTSFDARDPSCVARDPSFSSPNLSTIGEATNPILQTRRHRVRGLFSLVLLLIPLSLGSIILWLLNRRGLDIRQENQHHEVGAWSFLDAFWYSYCTLTTIGYGDLSYHHKRKHRTFLLIFMPCSVILGAAAIGNIASIFREIREEKKQTEMLDSMDYQMLAEMDKNGDGVDKNEFVLAMIKALNLVELSKIERFEKQFDDADVDGSGKLDKEDIEAIAAARAKLNREKVGFYEARQVTMAFRRVSKRSSANSAETKVEGARGGTEGIRTSCPTIIEIPPSSSEGSISTVDVERVHADASAEGPDASMLPVDQLEEDLDRALANDVEAPLGRSDSGLSSSERTFLCFPTPF